MKALLSILATALAVPAVAQTHDHAAMAAPVAPVATAKYTLDTPIETIAADPKGKAVLDTVSPGLTTHEMYDMFKSMSLNQVAPMSQGKMTPENLAKLQAELAKVK